MFYLTTHSTHFIYGYMASDIWLRTILIVRKETRCRHIGYSYRLTARVILYAPSHRQDNTYHSLCYTSCGALVGTRTAIGCPTNGKLKPHMYISKLKIHKAIKIQCKELYTINISQLGLFKIDSKIQFVLKTTELVWGGI